MTDFPSPLTPADCDLRDFPFMPLDVVRLRDSDIAAISNGDEFRCAVLLWCASWHQIPAGSLPDDDIVLSQYAGFGRVVKEWKKSRTGAMRGWIKCSDGRLYHPVVAEKANEAWEGRVKYREKKEADRARKAEERRLKKQQEDEEHERFNYQDNHELSEGQKPPVHRTAPQNPPENALTVERDSGQWTVDSGQLTSKPESSSQASTEVGETEHPDQLMPVGRHVQITLLLRAQGVLAQSANPIVHAWAENAKLTDEVLNLAILKAKAAKPDSQIPLNYLRPIVEQELNAPSPSTAPAKSKSDDWEWKRSKEGIERRGRELGMFARGGESHDAFRDRIQQALDKRKGQP